MESLRVLIIGSGGREHALAIALKRDPRVDYLAIAPGNAGTAAVAEQHAVDIGSGAEVAALATTLNIDLVVIGPEVPLVLGVADAVRAAGIACFGPSAAAARIEGSKAFAKDVMTAAGVRTARSEIVDNPAHLDAALDRFASEPAWVVKDDGLAAGKGVVVTDDRAAARAHAASLLDDGHPVLLESFLDGPEVSLLCIVDGETVVPLLPAQDHKRVGDGDTGPNTGGMGAYPRCRGCPLRPSPRSSTPLSNPLPLSWSSATVLLPACSTRVWPSPRTAPRSSSSTAASVIPRRRRYLRCSSRRWGNCSTPPRSGTSRISARCAGGTAAR
ncbi:Probable phosphoribosylamine--glycine ligase (GarS) [Mycobacteroides abscessus]|nr:Probable phosphoribosylamine--glycine ligase (GarS) [Mycobacteroides abscessus]